MRIITKGRYAVDAMLDLTLREGNHPVALVRVSESAHISLSYLEHLFGKLMAHGIVDAVRGPGGGYFLARDASEITVADIVLAVDESPEPIQTGVADCAITDAVRGAEAILEELGRQVMQFLDSVTLEVLAAALRENGAIDPSAREAWKKKSAVRHFTVANPLRPNTPNSVFALGGR